MTTSLNPHRQGAPRAYEQTDGTFVMRQTLPNIVGLYLRIVAHLVGRPAAHGSTRKAFRKHKTIRYFFSSRLGLRKPRRVPRDQGTTLGSPEHPQEAS